MTGFSSMADSLTEKRILCVLPTIHERRTGGGILHFEIISFLATRGRVAVVVPVAHHLREEFCEACDDPLLSGVEWHPLTERRVPSVRGIVERLLATSPSEVTKYASQENRRVLDSVRHNLRPNVELVISSLATAPYHELTLPASSRLYMINVDPAILRYDGPSVKKRLAVTIDRTKVDKLCRRALQDAGRVGAISAADVPMLKSMGHRTDIKHVPPLMRPQLVDRSRAAQNTVLITTNFTYSHNVTSLEWFLRESWAHVNPHARLTITGKDDGDRLSSLCRAHPRVTYVGCLSPHDFAEQFALSAVAVNPTRSGSGFQIKLLDALARGVPIVSTAFSNRVGPAIPSSDDPVELARLINARLIPGTTPQFDYTAFYETAIRSWDAFLFE